MKIDTFLAERWMDEYDTGIIHNLNITCPGALSLDGLMGLCGQGREATLAALTAETLGYGPVRGIPPLREGISALYTNLQPQDIMTAHGATGANHLALWALVEPGDRVISAIPAYQQMTAIPAAFGAEVLPLPLRRENGWLPDLDELSALLRGGAKLICLNSPNNPTGAMIPEGMLQGIVTLARTAGAWVLCDEAYWGLSAAPCPAMADLYERGISVSSVSKGFSMPGLRLGWLACRNRELMGTALRRRDYNTITCGTLDEAIAALAVTHRDIILPRNRAIAAENLDLLSTWMARQHGLSWVRPTGGTTALLHYAGAEPSEALCRRLLSDHGIYLLPGDAFGVPRSLRIGYAGPKAALAAGLEALELAL